MHTHSLPSIIDKKRRRLGQGHGSGRVKTSGRGTKVKKHEEISRLLLKEEHCLLLKDFRLDVEKIRITHCIQNQLS